MSLITERIPSKCNGCGEPLLLSNVLVDDGCPCNTPRGVNFRPIPCGKCNTDRCVKPGHRFQIDVVASTCAQRQPAGYYCRREYAHDGPCAPVPL